MKKEIISNPKVMFGAPCFEGTRIPEYIIKDLVHDGFDIQYVLHNYPSLNKEDIEYLFNKRSKDA